MTIAKTPLEAAIMALGGYVEHMGGGTSAWWFNLDAVDGIDAPARFYALVTFYEGDHEGDPDQPHWMAGLYKDDGDQQLCADNLTLAQALQRVEWWRDEQRRLRNASGCQEDV
jgi:hypothetical protein